MQFYSVESLSGVCISSKEAVARYYLVSFVFLTSYIAFATFNMLIAQYTLNTYHISDISIH